VDVSCYLRPYKLQDLMIGLRSREVDGAPPDTYADLVSSTTNMVRLFDGHRRSVGPTMSAR
ncbi:hypothetical protein PHLCEN_2v9918, partial [Hermanssonia centrifuga]